ncbi:hypothetical protein I5496_01985 [Citrobacter freundii]|uniref:hypothetical protein n=1 Tax=Citrobacter freundii TaxID=546 RepID=UPI0019050262|nr:hypothetical protein [Citrobacter freundii]MBJ9306975.1 hypothetical protein [Citrobacter freundii]
MDSSKSTTNRDEDQKNPNKKERNRYVQKTFLLISSLVIVGFLIYVLILLFGSSINSLIRKYQDFIFPLSAAVIGLLISMILTLFLKGPSKNTRYDNGNSVFKNSVLISLGLNNTFKLLAKYFLQNYFGMSLSKEETDTCTSERDDTKKSIKNRIMARLVIEASDDLKRDMSRFASDHYLDDLHSMTKQRILAEIDSQTTKGIFSLSLGVVTASIGMVILAASAFNAINSKDYIEYILHYLPRLSIAIVIEVFAYFFLRLYKQSLDEIKYFQNELTNIEMKYFGLMIIKRSNPEADLKELAAELIKTERNHVLEKGQSTVYLERDKLSIQQQKELGSIFSDFIKTSANVLKK